MAVGGLKHWLKVTSICHPSAHLSGKHTHTFKIINRQRVTFFPHTTSTVSVSVSSVHLTLDHCLQVYLFISRLSPACVWSAGYHFDVLITGYPGPQTHL